MKDRIHWIDINKALLVFTMIVGHSGRVDNLIINFIYAFHIPCFFILSGLLHKKTSLNKLINSLIIPTIAWNIILYPWYLYNAIYKQGEIINLELIFIKPILGLIIHDFKNGIPVNGPFWFVIVLFVNKLIANNITKWSYRTIICIISIITTLLLEGKELQSISFIPTRVLLSMPFYFLGIFISSLHSIPILNKSKRKSFDTIVFAASFSITFILSLALNRVDMYKFQFNNIILYILTPISGFIMLKSISELLYKVLGEKKWIQNISSGTLFILGSHNIILFTCSKLTNYRIFFHNDGIILSIIVVVLSYAPLSFCIKKAPLIIGKSNYKNYI